MRWPTSWLLLAVSVPAIASGPVDFGMAELNAAIEARGFDTKPGTTPVTKPRIVAELNTDPPETFRIDPYTTGGGHVTGGDLRGLMYGLLEAADQVRTDGKLKPARGAPALQLRGVQIAEESLARGADSPGFLDRYFAEMARDRFNRLEVTVSSAPAPGAVEMIRRITQTAAEYGVEIAIGFGTVDASSVERALTACTLVRAVVIHAEAFPDPLPLLRTLSAAGRRVVLEIPDGANSAGMIEAAGEQGTPVRFFSMFTGTALNPSPQDLYWVLDQAQGSDAVKAISGAGFEIASPAVEQGAAQGSDAERQPAIDSIADWGRFGYSRPLH